MENEEHKKITNSDLYEKQVALLKTFLAHGTITKAQFDKSFTDLTKKMKPSESKKIC